MTEYQLTFFYRPKYFFIRPLQAWLLFQSPNLGMYTFWIVKFRYMNTLSVANHKPKYFCSYQTVTNPTVYNRSIYKYNLIDVYKYNHMLL
jgi:hypothetical protein